MQYRALGKTGYSVSRLGFGAMRLPMTGEADKMRVDRERAVAMIHKAFEGGVNYIDSAVFYCNAESEGVVGEAVRSWRGGRIVVSTKNPCYDNDEKAWWGHLETSLERLGTGCIDIYNHHGLGWQRYSEFAGPHAFKWMQRAKDQGLIRHISFSFHDNNEALRKLADLGCSDVVTLQ